MNEDVQQPKEEPGYEFGYTPFEELPPAKVTDTNELITSGDSKTELLIIHEEPVQKNIPIELPLTNNKM